MATFSEASYILGPSGAVDGVQLLIDGQEWSVPADTRNRHWRMVQEALAAGRLQIAMPPLPEGVRVITPPPVT